MAPLCYLYLGCFYSDPQFYAYLYSFTKTSGFGIFTQMDGLSIQFRIAYDNFKIDYDFEAYKAIHGYNALHSVTDDFVDVHIYIDYVF